MDVLVVDDEFPLRAAVRRALSLEGYAVTDAASGEEAIELLHDLVGAMRPRWVKKEPD
jgi:CheY-like chemotaxis protein